MRLKAQRRAIYVAMGLTVLALIGGYALATLGLGQTNSVQQGSHTTTIRPVTGLSWDSTTLVGLEVAVTNSSCSPSPGCDVTSTQATDCAGGVPGSAGCLNGDFVEQVVLNTTAGTNLTGVVNITLYVTANGTTYTGLSFYYHDSSGNLRELITQDFGIGNATTGPTPVSAVTVIAQT
jgi:hypothetical protein